jgi:RNA polymerase primary sigma factor
LFVNNNIYGGDIVVRTKEKKTQDAINMDLCREIRKHLVCLLELIEGNDSSHFQKIKDFLGERRRKQRSGKTKYFYHLSVIEFINEELEQILFHSPSAEIVRDIEIMQQDKVANINGKIEELYVSNKEKIRRIAFKKCNGCSFLLNDLLQEGFFGLRKAAICFDETKGAKFLTYAAWYINLEMDRAILNGHGDMVIKTVHATDKRSYFLKRIKEEAAKGVSYTIDDLAREEGVSTSKIREVFDGIELSFQNPIGEDGINTIGDFVVYEHSLTPEEIVDRNDFAEKVRAEVANLSSREQTIITMRFGQGDHTLDSVGGHLGITNERVRQIEKRILEKLRVRFQGAGIYGAGA